MWINATIIHDNFFTIILINNLLSCKLTPPLFARSIWKKKFSKVIEKLEITICTYRFDIIKFLYALLAIPSPSISRFLSA